MPTDKIRLSISLKSKLVLMPSGARAAFACLPIIQCESETGCPNGQDLRGCARLCASYKWGIATEHVYVYESIQLHM